MNDERPVANSPVNTTQDSKSQDPEQGRPPQEWEQGGVPRISRPRGALRWLVRKTRELLFIGLVGIPAGLLFLESQSTQPVARDWFNTAYPITCLVWVCIGVLLALDNFAYLAENKERIIAAAVGFCTPPATLGRYTSFDDNNSVYAICLVLAVICPKALTPWTATKAEQHERRN